jgi:hypothetical protein
MTRKLLVLAAVIAVSASFSAFGSTVVSADGLPICMSGGLEGADRCDFVSWNQCEVSLIPGSGSCVRNPTMVAGAFASQRIRY